MVQVYKALNEIVIYKQRIPVMVLPRRLSIYIWLFMCFLAVADCLAATAHDSNPASAIATIDRVLTAWRHGDAHALAELYEADGDFVSPTGVHAVGRLAIEGFYRAAFTNGYEGSDASAKILQSRIISLDIMLVDGEWTITPTAASRITQAEAGLFVAVLHRRDGVWYITALREQSSATTFVKL